MKTLTLNVTYLSFAASTALPLLTGIITKVSANARVKAAVLIALAIIAGLVQTLIKSKGVITFHSLADNSISAYLVAVVMHYGALKPLGATDVVAAVAPGVGLGAAQPVLDLSGPPAVLGEPAQFTPIAVPAELADLADRFGISQ